ncbi:hypothetical protein HY988_04830 [Candidatus Micrarchaeota archaeon]|nr:hypothetical protein [Candidatus Micrarchaeota archaeon]
MRRLIEPTKQQFQIRFDFGRHLTLEDAASLRARFNAFKPQIYVKEQGDMRESERLEETIARNAAYKAVSRSPSKRRKFLADVSEQHKGSPIREFVVEEDAVLSQGIQKTIYFVEGYSPAQIVTHGRAFRKALTTDPQIIKYLFEGKITEVLHLNETTLRDYTQSLVIERNSRIINGFEMMLMELPELVLNIHLIKEIRVFVRYGAVHGAIVPKVAAMGFDARLLDDAPPSLEIDERLMLQISFDEGRILTDAEKIQLTFTDLYKKLLQPSMERTHTERVRKLELAYQKVGGESGFLELVRSVAAQSTDEAMFEKLLTDSLIPIKEAVEKS